MISWNRLLRRRTRISTSSKRIGRGAPPRPNTATPSSTMDFTWRAMRRASFLFALSGGSESTGAQGSVSGAGSVSSSAQRSTAPGRGGGVASCKIGVWLPSGRRPLRASGEENTASTKPRISGAERKLRISAGDSKRPPAPRIIWP